MDSQESDMSCQKEPEAEIQAKAYNPMEAFMEQIYGDTCCSTSSSSSSVSPSIFTTPFPGLQFQEPQLASIGPYHCTKNLPLQQYKYSYLDTFISRTRKQGRDVRFYVQQMMTREWRARRCYSEDLSMPSPEFVEMMLLDGCFIMEILCHFGGSEDWELCFPIEPWQLPILVQDLLILENQIPFFVLKMLFESLESQVQEGTPAVSLCTMALKFFDLVFPRSMDIGCEFDHSEPHHLLDLFLLSIRISNPSHFHMKTMVFPDFVYSHLKITDTRNRADISNKAENVTNPKFKEVEHEQQCDSPPPFHLMKSLLELQASGIKLRPRIAARFTDIVFNNGVLEIPSVTIDDLFIAILVNCVAFEHCSKTGSKDLTAYVSFMSRLIRRPTDAELLCSNGIISGFSHNDTKVVESFHLLWLNMSELRIQHSYLSERLKELECYYTRFGKTPRSFISRYWTTLFFCTTNLLFAFNHSRSGVNQMIHLAQQVKFNGIYPDFQGVITCPQDHSSFICNSVFSIAEFVYNRSRGRISVDLSFGKFMAFFFLNVAIVIITVTAGNIPAPTLAIDDRVVDVKDSITVDEQVVDSVIEGEDQHIEVEDSTVTWDKTEMVVDCVSRKIFEEYYNEPWTRILEHKGVRMLVSALIVT